MDFIGSYETGSTLSMVEYVDKTSSTRFKTKSVYLENDFV